MENIVIRFNGIMMTPSIQEIHLGIPIGPNADRIRIEMGVNDLYRRTNTILAQFKHVAAEVKYFLFKSFCMSLYGSPMWDLSKPQVQSIFTAWRKCVRRVMGIPTRTHNNLIPFIINDIDIQTTLEKRAINFLRTSFKSENHFLKIGIQLVLAGSRSPLGKSLNLVSAKYRTCKHDLVRGDNPPVWTNENNDDVLEQNGNQIRELIQMRDYGHEILSGEEIDEIIVLLCTH